MEQDTAIFNAFTASVITEYDRLVRTFDAVHAVAVAGNGFISAFGEVTDLASEMLYGDRTHDITDALWEHLHRAFGDYHARLVAECRAFWDECLVPIIYGAGEEYTACEWCAGDGCKSCGGTGRASDDVSDVLAEVRSDIAEHFTVHPGDAGTEYRVTDTTRFGGPVLTVGALLSALALVPDHFHVLIATDGWWTNVECIEIDADDADGGSPVVKIYPTTKAYAAGDFDGRQF